MVVARVDDGVESPRGHSHEWSPEVVPPEVVPPRSLSSLQHGGPAVALTKLAACSSVAVGMRPSAVLGVGPGESGCLSLVLCCCCHSTAWDGRCPQHNPGHLLYTTAPPGSMPGGADFESAEHNVVAASSPRLGPLIGVTASPDRRTVMRLLRP